MNRDTMTEFEHADGVGDWRVLGDGASAWFDAPSMTAGAGLVSHIAKLAPGGLPLVDLRPGGVRVRIGPERDLTAADVDLARSISAAAREVGLTADPTALQTLELVVDTPDRPSVEAFWAAVLGYEPAGAHRLADPARRTPGMSFREAPPRALQDRLHVDVVRASDAVEAARATVGQEPSGPWGVALTDPDGNIIDAVPGGSLTEAPETADWQALFGAMVHYPVDSPVRASDLASTVARLADDAGLPLMVDLRPDGVTIDSGKDLWEDDGGSPRSDFVDLAARVQAAARELGLSADPMRPRFLQVCFAAVDVPTVRAFWASVLGYAYDPREHVTDLYDPRGLNPVVFFQSMDASDTARRERRDRVHLELVLPYDHAHARVEAALAAGGRVVAEAPPRRWTLADPEGNTLDIVTSRSA